MKKAIFLSLCLVSGIVVYAQEEGSEAIVTPTVLMIDLKEEQSIVPISKIVGNVMVLDWRDDSACIAFLHHKVNENKPPQEYQVAPSFSPGIANWTKKYLGIQPADTATTASLLIVVRKLWVSPEVAPFTNQNDKSLEGKEIGFDKGIVAKLDFFLLKEDTYYPLYQTDSIFIYEQTLQEDAGFFVNEAFKKSLAKLFKFKLTDVLQRGRKLTASEFTQYGKMIDPAILQTTNYKKGVYKNFEEFKSNAPSINEFEIRPGKLGDVLYVKEGQDWYPLREAWGCSDGKSLFINSGDKYARLFQKQRTFYFAGIKGIVRKSKYDLLQLDVFTYATGIARKHTKLTKKMHYFMIDMETGEVY